MPIPAYSEIMLPLLRYASDGKSYRLRDAMEAIAGNFNLSSEERLAMLQSGHQRIFDNRVGWARTYLKKAGLLEYTNRGEFQITQRGQDVLNENLPVLNAAYLRRFPEFQEFQLSKPEVLKSEVAEIESDAIDPREFLDLNYQKMTQALAEDLLEIVKHTSPRFFEQLVVDLLVAMGYGGSEDDAKKSVTPYGNDGGIDGIIKEDRLGLEAIYLQAKRWDAVVGRPVVQAFAGSLEGFKARKGILITTSGFQKTLRNMLDTLRKDILIDGKQLVEYMIEFNVGVSEKNHLIIKDIDSTYFQLV